MGDRKWEFQHSTKVVLGNPSPGKMGGLDLEGAGVECGLPQLQDLCLPAVQRAVYKDLVLLLQKDSLLTAAQLKAKGELSFEQDQLMAGGQLGELHNGTQYREVRQFCSGSGHHLVRFYFLTRVYSEYLEGVLEELTYGPAPDLVIINSCLWDLSRYGRCSMESYRENLERVFMRMDQVLPDSCLLVWNMAMPLGERVTGGFLLPEASDQSPLG
ncbi:hypothetical protein BU61_190 [Pontoporia blainvillei]|uniref:PC-esterase domain-containing protein 1A n=1 Tax=Pontoporia blainvillei TaxID=48723 RepID=A0ABX0S175_PONBL|nr:hypothetical protein [Pontoporia blainvillei]